MTYIQNNPFPVKCWKGYERVPGTKKGAKGSCRKSSPAKMIDDPVQKKKQKGGGTTKTCLPASKIRSMSKSQRQKLVNAKKSAGAKGKGRNFRTTKEGAGMTKKGVAEYRRKNPGSKLKTAVTGKVKPGSKAAKRRKSFCARSKGWTGERGRAARRRWKC